MKRQLVVMGLASLLCGCATVLQSPTETVVPPSAHGEKWAISAQDDSGMFSSRITLYVNGTRVASGTVNLHRHSADLTGSFEQHAVLGDCTIVDAPRKSLASWGSYQCVVYVDGSKVTTLIF